MTNQSEYPVIPKEYTHNEETKEEVWSFPKALEIIKSRDTRVQELKLRVALTPDSKEKEALREIPAAFADIDTIRKFHVFGLKATDTLVAEALRAGIKNDNVTCLEFEHLANVKNQDHIEIICQGFKERSVGVQLRLNNVSKEFLIAILEASYSKCFSFYINKMNCYQSKKSFKFFFSRTNLFYLNLSYKLEMEESIWVDLTRCIEFWPGLRKLDVWNWNMSLMALKRLPGSLKSILEQGHVFEDLRLYSQSDLNDRLAFCWFSLLESDLISNLKLHIESDLSPAIVKSISSSVANTRNLSSLNTGNSFSSGTKFRNFCLQEKDWRFEKLFKVNP